MFLLLQLLYTKILKMEQEAYDNDSLKRIITKEFQHSEEDFTTATIKRWYPENRKVKTPISQISHLLLTLTESNG